MSLDNTNGNDVLISELRMKKQLAQICGMTRNQLIDRCRELYKKDGMAALLFDNLKKSEGLYYRLYRFGITQGKLLKKLGVEEEFRKYKKIKYGWTWERILKETKPIVDKLGFLPPAGWFQKNDYSSIVFAVYGLDKTWNDLRLEFDAYKGSSFVESRNGIRWRSHPEASMSNFLYARGIKHKLGRKYPDRFAQYADQKYGYYDLTFLDRKGRWIDVEIWGDTPMGHNEKGYAKKRKMKERFNKKNDRFVGIDFQDCFDEEQLAYILKRFIGRKKPYIFEKPFDREIQSTHWSNADELIEYCRHLVKSFPGGKFPTEEWLRKRGKWRDREGVAYNTLSVYIKTWLGGMRKLRQILGQPEASTIKWDRETALAEYKKWYEKYGYTPGSARSRFRQRKMNISKEEVDKAIRISTAAEKYLGGARRACKLLGIKHSIRWNKKKVLEEFNKWYEKYHCTPRTALRRLRLGSIKISRDEADRASSLAAAIPKYMGGNIRACELLGIEHRIRWNKKKALSEFKKWYDKYNCTPLATYHRFRNGQVGVNREEADHAARLCAAVYKHVGGNLRACELLGIKPKRFQH